MTIPTSPSPDWILRNRAEHTRLLGPAGEHQHVWGPLGHSLFGDAIRRCQVGGCSIVCPLDDPDEWCHECGAQFAINEDGTAQHVSAETPDGIDHDADADHVPYSLPDEED